MTTTEKRPSAANYDYQLRIEALRFAIARPESAGTNQVLKDAEKYFVFLKGQQSESESV